MIPYGRHHIDEEDIAAVSDLLRSGMLTQGPMVEEFENAVREYTGAKFAVAVASCTAALHIGAEAAGIGPGKSVVTTPITFVASALAGLYARGGVHFSDVDTATVNMSAEALEASFEKHRDIGLVIPVHYAGYSCDMDAIKNIADARGVPIMEDAAHALGGYHADGSKIGSCTNSLMTCFSFHPVKAIAAGEGGMVTTNDEQIYRKLIRLRSHGINKLDDPYLLPDQAMEDGERNPWYYEMQQMGYHYRITDIQCALALSQLKKLDKFVARRHELAKRYDSAFADFENMRPTQLGHRQGSGLHLYTVRIDFEKIGKSRKVVMNTLREYGVGSQVHYIPVPAHPYFRDLGFDPHDYPNAWQYYEEALSIPLFYTLTDAQQDQVVQAFQEIVG